MTTLTLDGWAIAPRIGVVVPDRGHPGWADAAFWCANLEAWGFPVARLDPVSAGDARVSMRIVPAAVLDALDPLDGSAATIVSGSPGASRIPTAAVLFPFAADTLDRTTTEAAVRSARSALLDAARGTGLVSIARWPHAARAALVVDGDVDHPTGVDPECARYVAPSLETAHRAGFDRYGIFVAAANVSSEPASFPALAEYYNHSLTHPYSHWNRQPWEALDHDAMRHEIEGAAGVLRDEIGADDHRLFRLPHFHLEAWDRTADVLEELGYRAESSIGANLSVTAGLPFHPSRRPWSDRADDAAYARTDPDPHERRPFLEIPISVDPTDPSFPNGCCSYNTLGEGVRDRSARPEAFEEVLVSVVQRAREDEGLAHLFIDPPDAGYGRLAGDRADYASAVERFLRWAATGDDDAIMSTAELVGWWLAREGAIARLRVEAGGGALTITVDDPPPGTSLVVVSSDGTRSFHDLATTSA